MKTGASFARGKNDGVYRTPDDFRAAVVARFGYPHVDLACTRENVFGREGLHTPAWDSLQVDWRDWIPYQPARPYGWLNPPFAHIAPWAKKAAESGARVLMLVPAAIGSNWYRDYVHKHARVYALNGRLDFGSGPYPKDCTLCDYGDEPGLEIWSWQTKK